MSAFTFELPETQETILKRVDGSKVKIEVRGSSSIHVSVLICPVGKRKFVDPLEKEKKSAGSRHRSLKFAEKKKLEQETALQYVTEKEILSAVTAYTALIA